jgi:enoyl-CoA hydratase/carnithine racemase
VSALAVERRGELAVLRLSNPKKRNALDPPLLDALRETIAALPSDGVRAAVLTGEGDVFSSGFDLALLEGAAFGAHPLEHVLSAMTEGALPIVAALNGLAFGGGCELAIGADLRVAHPAVELKMPPVRLGLVYPAAGLERFCALIGVAHTRELFLTAQAVDAERALSWGMVDRVVPAAEVLDTALGLAGEIAKGAPLAVRGTRAALARIAQRLGEDARVALRELERAAFESADACEARLARKERRPARFCGE